MRAALFIAVVLAAPALAQDWSGTWEGDGVRLELTGSGQTWSGSLAVSGARYPVEASSAGPSLRGAFAVDGTRFTFTAALDGGRLRLESDGTTRWLTRVAPPQQQVAWTWEALAVQAEGAQASRARPGGGLRAPALLQGALAEIARAFGARPRAVGAFCDAEGREGQALFEAVDRGTPVRGVVAVQAGDPATVLVGWTPAARLAATWPALSAALQGSLPGAGPKPAPVQWQPVFQLPDGSGQIRLPAGWTATFAQKGAIDASGPQGSLSLGAAATVFTPEAAAQYWAKPPVVAPYRDPASTLRTIVEANNAVARQNGGAVTEQLELVEQTPTDYPGGQAAFIHAKLVVVVNGQRSEYRALSLVVMAPINNESWMYYLSQIAAPAPSWAASLPVLLEAWASWKVSDQEIRSRLEKAARDMREINEIMRGVSAERANTFDNTNRAFGYALRGEWPVEDTATGRRNDVENGALKPTIEELNKAAGYDRFREVPLQELNRW